MSRVDELLSTLSTREKVGQLNQRMYGWDAVRPISGGYELTDAFHAELERWSGLGALYGVFRSDAWSGRGWHNGIPPEDRAAVAAQVQDAVRAASAHGTAALLVEEAPHGHQALGASLLPVNLAVGATWRPELYEQAMGEVSRSLRADGVHVALVSALDLLRDPRWGRSEECFSESPSLAAAMTTALVCGAQGVNRARLDDGSGVGVVLKHFAAQGDGIGGRNGHSATLGTRDLRSLHLLAAHAGIEAGAVGVMAAYTDLDGIPCCANRALLTEVLRDDWEFDGIVMADGKAIDRMISHLGSPSAAGAAALDAGVDLSLWDEAYAVLEDALAEYPALTAALDRSCRRVLELKDRFGLLAPSAPLSPGSSVFPAVADHDPTRKSSPESVVASSGRVSTRALSRDLAAASLTLIHNDGALPVVPGSGERRWAVVGPNAHRVTAMLGDYVPPLAPGAATSIFDAIRHRADQDGIDVIDPVLDIAGPDLATLDELAAVDRVVVVLGGTSHRRFDDTFADNGAIDGRTTADCGEGVDRASLGLPGGQDEFLACIRRYTTAPLVVIVVAGRPYALGDVVANSDAVLLSWYPGPEGAQPIAEVLFGDRQPTGRLPVTLLASPLAVPLHADDRHSATGVYQDQPHPMLRPFGFGLGYATLALQDVRSELVVADPDVPKSATVEFTLDLIPSAPLAGWSGEAHEVIQLYAERAGSVELPRRELLFFQSVCTPADVPLRHRFSIPADRAFIAPSDRAPLAPTRTTFTIVVGSSRRSVAVTLPDTSAGIRS